MNRLRLLLPIVAAALLAALPIASQDRPDPVSASSFATISCFVLGADTAGAAGHGFDLADLDRSVRPCDNFYEFAAGGWVKNNPVPAAYPSWSSFSVLVDHNQQVLKEILESAASRAPIAKPGTNEQRLGDFYASCMNEDAVNQSGINPVADDLDRINKIATLADLRKELARLHAIGVGAGFRFGSSIDFKDSTQQIAVAFQGGLGLPDRDYYVNTDEKSVTLRGQYVEHVTRMFKLMGDEPDDAAAHANTVMTVETALATASVDRVARREAEKNYHKMSIDEAQSLTPHFIWKAYFSDLGVHGIETINIGQPDFFKAFDAALASTSLADWKTYLRWHLIHSAAPTLASYFEQENFEFFNRTLTGSREMLPRWKRCVAVTDRQLGDALGEAYVAKAFPPEARARALQMVENLRAALREDLATLDWMSPATRKAAIEKLDAIDLKIGYPSKWKSYAGLTISRKAFARNVENAQEFEFRRDVDKIGKPVDRTEWGMTPPTVNAYYNSTRNEIVFPAGILQMPFYDPNRDDAMNYGGIGAVIGHEMTHGFDDQGAKFDPAGNLRNWWTPEDLANFQSRGDCIVKQFDGFEVEPGLFEKGKLVEGESIADFGGLTIAFRAFEKTLQGKPHPAEIDGFTPEQRFFLSWAAVWRSNHRPEQARLLTKTNSHPLGRFRAIGPLSNMPEFEKSWGCKPGDGMVRSAESRCRIW